MLPQGNRRDFMKWLSGGLAATAGFVLMPDMPSKTASVSVLTPEVRSNIPIDSEWELDRSSKVIRYEGAKYKYTTVDEFQSWLEKQSDKDIEYVLSQ